MTEVTLDWPSTNGDLLEILLGGATIYDTRTPPTSINVTESDWLKGEGLRIIVQGKTETLTFRFDAAVVPSSYTLTIKFSNGCWITITN
jgi:hypothetical protein